MHPNLSMEEKKKWVFPVVTGLLWPVVCVIVYLIGAFFFGNVFMNSSVVEANFGTVYKKSQAENLIDPNWPTVSDTQRYVIPALYDNYTDSLSNVFSSVGLVDESMDGTMEWFLSDCTLAVCYLYTDLNGNVIREGKMFLSEESPCASVSDLEESTYLKCFHDSNKNTRYNGFVDHDCFSEQDAIRYRELQAQYPNLQVRVDSAYVDGILYYPVTVSLVNGDTVIETWNLEQDAPEGVNNEVEACENIWIHSPLPFFNSKWWAEKTPLEQKVYDEAMMALNRIDYSLQHTKVITANSGTQMRMTGYSVISNGAVVEHIYLDMRPAFRRLIIPAVLFVTAFYWLAVGIIQKVLKKKRAAVSEEPEEIG